MVTPIITGFFVWLFLIFLKRFSLPLKSFLVHFIVCIIATAFGATSIERHITLSRSMYGSDQSESLEYAGLERMIRDVRLVHSILGDGVKKIWDSEIPAMKKLRIYS